MSTHRPLRRYFALAALALALPLTASATTKVIEPVEGAIYLEAGEEVIYQSVAKTPADTRMDVTVSVDNDNEILTFDTTCQINDGTMSCLNVGSAQMDPIVGAANAWAFDPASLGLVDWSCDQTPTTVRQNKFFQCELELNDFGDCANTCQGLLGDSFGGAITAIGPGCQLLCTCYDNSGTSHGTFPGNDTHILEETGPLG